MLHDDYTTTDLRDLVEAHLGKPLAASMNAALWRCPSCPPERHGLLMVSVDEHRCLSGYPCDGGAGNWMRTLEQRTEDSTRIGVSV